MMTKGWEQISANPSPLKAYALLTVKLDTQSIVYSHYDSAMQSQKSREQEEDLWDTHSAI